ncbi:(2Fe-2S)-binding protein [Actinomycetospora sp. NBRC 106375]|uniref:(2Fe-2S)-binding protein n=1 Tax=Actinomycetospora sp. NBRC 106375 TaxID=3032207 RepID=UPI0025550BD6|nr:(2Fe-2S)-binding protein [Actinomycetospora sp. NBRC 106375]
MIGGRALLTDVAHLGRAFAVETGPRHEAELAGWRPLTALSADPAVLGRALGALVDRLGVTDRRVAASVLFSGLAARVVAPVLAVAVLHDRLLVALPDTLHWRAWDGGLMPLWMADPASVPMGDDRLHEALVEPLGALVAAVRAECSISQRLLWGNAVAAVGGVLRVISRERSSARDRAVSCAEELLARPPWAGTGRVLVSPTGATVARRTCCLVWRLPGATTCADCVLGPGRRPGTTG